METQDNQTVETVSTEANPAHVTETPEVVTPSITYVNGKYQNASELEKGYTNLESKLGNFTGAPDEYSLNEGVTLSDEAFMETFSEIAKNGNMNNDMFNDLIGAYSEHQESEQKAYQEEQMKALGENANERLQNLKDWSNANLGEHAESLLESVTDAKAVEALEMMIEKTKAPAPVQAPTAPAMSRDKILEMQMAKDANGNRKMAMDPNYEKEVRSAMNQFLSAGGKM